MIKNDKLFQICLDLKSLFCLSFDLLLFINNKLNKILKFIRNNIANIDFEI